jgi:Winged helix-turn helix
MKVVITRGFIWFFWLDIGRICLKWSGVKVMAAWRRAIELSLGDEDAAKLKSIAQSRTEPASRVERARILLAYREDPSFFAASRALGLHHQTVQRCVERAVVEGPMAALDDRPRLGREPRQFPTDFADGFAWRSHHLDLTLQHLAAESVLKKRLRRPVENPQRSRHDAEKMGAI